MAMRIIKSSGDVYADLGIKKCRNAHQGSTEEAARLRSKRRGRCYKSRMKAALHETTEDLVLAGMISEKRMADTD